MLPTTAGVVYQYLTRPLDGGEVILLFNTYQIELNFLHQLSKNVLATYALHAMLKQTAHSTDNFFGEMLHRSVRTSSSICYGAQEVNTKQTGTETPALLLYVLFLV